MVKPPPDVELADRMVKEIMAKAKEPEFKNLPITMFCMLSTNYTAHMLRERPTDGSVIRGILLNAVDVGYCLARDLFVAMNVAKSGEES